MASVYTSSMAVPITRRDKRISSSSGTWVTTSATGGTTIPPSPPSAGKMSFGFIDDQAPSILDYGDHYAERFGQLPEVRLWTIDEDNNFIERSEKPKFIMSAGSIETIVYDLAEIATGFIILS